MFSRKLDNTQLAIYPCTPIAVRGMLLAAECQNGCLRRLSKKKMRISSYLDETIEQLVVYWQVALNPTVENGICVWMFRTTQWFAYDVLLLNTRHATRNLRMRY